MAQHPPAPPRGDAEDGLRLRAYDPARDLDTCLAIWRRASEVGHPFLDAATLDADAVLIRDVYMPAADITVAEDGGRVVGFIALLDDLVGGLFVDPGAHRRGRVARWSRARSRRAGGSRSRSTKPIGPRGPSTSPAASA